VLNQHIFKLEDLKNQVNSTLKHFLLQANASRAYKYLAGQKYFGKFVVQIE
jgi:hypothetical protein